jgi:recombination protein RecA
LKARPTPPELKKFQFLDPKLIHVHHKDEDHKNNALDNLEALTVSAHLRMHRETHINSLAIRAVSDEIVSIKKLGKQQTYDVEMAGPNNFIANGLVVHNSGKTTICLQAVAEVQSQGGWAVYYDNEHKLDPDYAEALGVDPKKLIISQPDTVEDFFDSAFKIVAAVKARRERGKSRRPVMVVLDSINSAISKAVFESEAGDSHYAPEARVWSKQLPKLNKAISREDIALVLISQVREKIGLMFGDKDEIGGGKAPKFYASLIIKIVRTGTEAENNIKTANKIEATCKKNQIAVPFRKASFIIRFGKGASFPRSLLLEATRCGIIEKAGNVYLYNGAKLGLGEVGAAKALRKQPELQAEINTKFREHMGWAPS